MLDGFSCRSSHAVVPIFRICASNAGVGPHAARRARCSAGSRLRIVGGCLTVTPGLAFAAAGALPVAATWYSVWARVAGVGLGVGLALVFGVPATMSRVASSRVWLSGALCVATAIPTSATPDPAMLRAVRR